MSKKKHTTVLVSIASIAVLATVIAISSNRSKAPDLTGKKPEEIKQYFKSEKFQSMTLKDQIAAKKQIYGPQKKKRNERFIDQAKTYSKLPAVQKNVYLDKLINEYVTRAAQKKTKTTRNTDQKDTQTKTGYSNTSSTGTKKRISPEKIRGGSEKMDPQKRAYITELKNAMQRRMDERGIKLPK